MRGVQLCEHGKRKAFFLQVCLPAWYVGSGTCHEKVSLLEFSCQGAPHLGFSCVLQQVGVEPSGHVHGCRHLEHLLL